MQKEARMGWISVKDKMPDKYVQIIIYDKVMGVTFGYYGDFKGEKWYTDDVLTDAFYGNNSETQLIDDNVLYHVTHWMSLPDEPEE